MSYTLHLGDCLSVLPILEAGSVHCCVTSPPYFGLRDYGTAVWSGGDPECNHKAPDEWLRKQFKQRSTLNSSGPNEATHKAAAARRWYKPDNSCRCGASRVDRQLGLEPTPEEYVSRLVEVFRLVRRVLRDDGTLWLNLGDSYASGEVGRKDNGRLECDQDRWNSPMDGQSPRSERRLKMKTGLKSKQLLGIPWRVAFALQADGWVLRSDIIWHKPNPMPESVRDRPTKAHEYLFLLAKSPHYHYDTKAVQEPVSGSSGGWQSRAKRGLLKSHEQGFGGNSQTSQFGLNGSPATGRGGVAAPGLNGRNRRSVWTIATRPFKGAHFATFPPALVQPCVLAGCPEGGTILDPFAGAGTTGLVAIQHQRRFVGIELNEDYLEMARQRLDTAQLAPTRKAA